MDSVQRWCVPKYHYTGESVNQSIPHISWKHIGVYSHFLTRPTPDIFVTISPIPCLSRLFFTFNHHFGCLNHLTSCSSDMFIKYLGQIYPTFHLITIHFHYRLISHGLILPVLPKVGIGGLLIHRFHIPDAPCMAYLPTFG